MRAILTTATLLLLVSFGCSERAAPTAPTSQPASSQIKNVVLVLVDTLRADHMGCYGYLRDTSPNIDRLARESVLFEHAYSVSPWTRTSIVTLFTSLNPASHACQDKEDSVADELVTMAEIFKDNGFRTGGFSTNISISAKFNATQGFDDFLYFERPVWSAAHPERRDPGYVPIEGMMPAVFAWLDRQGDQPFFLYFHSTDPHYKYDPPAEYALWGQETPYDLYDGEIRYTDRYVGELIEHLRRSGKLDETVLVFVADHGEEWGDHLRMGHGHSLYNELLEVPLIVRHPSLTIGRRSEVVRLTDVLPTLVELCSLKTPEIGFQGRSLVPLLSGLPDPSPDDQFVLGEVMYPSKIEGLSYQADGWKLIWTMQDSTGKRDKWELYYAGHDGREKTNLLRANPELADKLRTALKELRAQYAAEQVEGVKATLSPDTLDALRSLGYVD